MYIYRGVVQRVVDGNTVEAWVDLGFRMFVEMRLGLYGIEVDNGEVMGQLAKMHIIERVLDREVVLLTHQSDYGWQTEIYLAGVNLNKELVEKGLARLI